MVCQCKLQQRKHEKSKVKLDDLEETAFGLFKRLAQLLVFDVRLGCTNGGVLKLQASRNAEPVRVVA